ncbi:MAG: UbiA family prenyltransferase, partial [Methanobacterium sp.]
ISGAFRIYLASILIGTQVSMLTCLAGFLIIYSVYTLDRTLDSEEDSINREELSGSSKSIGLTITIVTFLLGSGIFAKEGILVYALLPFVTGFLYSKGIKIGKCALRLKGGLGVKNIVVGITWGLCTAGVAGIHCNSTLAFLTVLTLYGVKTFVNSILDDFKDIKGDTVAGIKTLPVCYGALKTRDIHLF